MSYTQARGQLACGSSSMRCVPRASLAFPISAGRSVGRLSTHNEALAISGGVDSMALAYLCSQLRKFDPNFIIADNPVANFRAFVVDHGLRENSAKEARAVRETMVKVLGIYTEVLPIAWSKEIGPGIDPRELSNFETVARRARYRVMGKRCALRQFATLLLAHHEDDQYETVLMRLLSGHRGRGLRGMRRANNIPECEGLFGVYHSGWVDDQKSPNPYYITRVDWRQRQHLIDDLRAALNGMMLEEEEEELTVTEDVFADVGGEYDALLPEENAEGSVGQAGVPTLPIEDGGVWIYRPLLEFSKDRLIATCVHNNIPWFEDHTNLDPTLTMRNAVRRMYRNHQLPQALQKPAILSLAARAETRIRADDAEADRLLRQTVLRDFQPHVGSLMVQFPRIRVPRISRYSNAVERYRRRLAQKRAVAGLLIQRIIALLSPETQTKPISDLQNVISFLFPSLASPSSSHLETAPPKAFGIAGLHFAPIDSTPKSVTSSVSDHPRTWYISRLPYASTVPLPTWRIRHWSSYDSLKESKRGGAKRGLHRAIGAGSGLGSPLNLSAWLPWKFYDGRFWVRLTHRLPCRVAVMPFSPDHAKSFRESLSPEDRDRLAAVLKRYAPGKVRYTLPAIYSEEYLDLDNVENPDISKKKDRNLPALSPIDPAKMRLLALPTLDFQLPGLDRWLLYEIRHKRVDRQTMATAGTFSRGSFKTPECRRRIGGSSRRGCRASIKNKRDRK